MKQQDLDRLRRKVGPEFSHLLGEVDEEEGLGIDGGEGEDDGFHKTMGAICSPPSAARSTSSVPTFAQELEMAEFMKGGLTEVGIQMSQGTSFPLPKPQPGPHQPGPASPTGRPTGVPYPSRVDVPTRIPTTPSGNPKVREAGFRVLDAFQRFRKAAPRGSWESAIERTVETMHDATLKALLDAIDRNDVDGLVATIRNWKRLQTESVGFA